MYIIITLLYDNYCTLHSTSFKNYCKSKMLIIEPENTLFEMALKLV